MEKNINSVLILDKIAFDKIEFQRKGFRNDSELEVEFETQVAQKKNEDIYKVTLIFRGNKEKEYTIEISLTGFFSFEQTEDISEQLKRDLVSKNAVAILMPYLRSEVSLLTAQPGTESVVLPAFNINKMME